jgi:microcystin-dependent protein
MSDVFIGQIVMFGGNFAPRNFAFCNGQLMPIAQNQALFALLGTTYGGDGVTTFALPDLRSRLPVHVGQGPGLSSYAQGQAGGTQTETIVAATMPAHNHTLQATQTIATAAAIGATLLPGQPTVGNPAAFYAAPQSGQPPLVPQQLASATCSLTGGSQPHTNLMPSLCVTFIIALQGIFPSRN